MRLGAGAAWEGVEPRDGARTAGRGPAMARAYGGVRHRMARRSVRGRALEHESAAGVVAR
jgi:hypothetical protein